MLIQESYKNLEAAAVIQINKHPDHVDVLNVFGHLPWQGLLTVMTAATSRKRPFASGNEGHSFSSVTHRNGGRPYRLRDKYNSRYIKYLDIPVYHRYHFEFLLFSTGRFTSFALHSSLLHYEKIFCYPLYMCIKKIFPSKIRISLNIHCMYYFSTVCCLVF